MWDILISCWTFKKKTKKLNSGTLAVARQRQIVVTEKKILLHHRVLEERKVRKHVEHKKEKKKKKNKTCKVLRWSVREREREKQGVGERLSGRERERERINMEEEAGALILPLAFQRDPKNRNRKGLIIITLHNTAEHYPVVLFWQPGIHDRMKLFVFFFLGGGRG